MKENHYEELRSSRRKNFMQEAHKSRTSQITPYNTRKCTDIGCIIIYSMLSLVVICTFFYSFILEKEKNIFKPEDPDGHKCGSDDAADYPYIYFPAPFTETITSAVCVKSCPDSSEYKLDCLVNSLIKSCEFNISNHFNRSEQFIIYSTTTNALLSMCQPDERVLFDAINSKINTYELLMNLEEIYESLHVILIACPLICIGLVALYVFVITKVKDLRLLFKGLITLFLIFMLAFSIYSFTSEAKRIFMYMPYLGIFVFVLTVCLVGGLIYCRRYLERSLTLINMGVEYVRKNRSLIFMSLGLFLIWVIIFAVEVLTLFFIYSINSAAGVREEYTFAYFVGIENSLFVKILMGLTIVHYLWTNLILYSMGEYICMAASTYWILDVKNNFKNSLFTLLQFHLGSVIFGSLASTILGKLTTFLYVFMPHANGSLLCFCCDCSALNSCYRRDCWRNYVGIFSDLNYIRVAMKGEDFVTAGRGIAAILLKDLHFVDRSYRLARYIVFISKMLVALCTTILCYIIIELSSKLEGYFLTNIIIFLFSSFLCSFAFDSYDRSFEVILITILMCPEETNKFSTLSNEPIENALNKDKLFNSVLNWFKEEKEKELNKRDTEVN